MAALKNFNERLREAAEGPDEGHNIPNAAVVAVDGKGSVFHSAAYGSYVPLPPKPSSPGKLGAEVTQPQKFTVDTVCWMASCTKLMTTVACMQCVENGTLDLEADITNLLPELKDPDILLKFVDDGSGNKKPLFRKAKRKITLRNLLTHSNGLAYDFSHPKTNAWSEWVKDEYRAGRIPKPKSNIVRAFVRPLLYEPDEGWSYGFGIDWAGIAVSRASNLSLEGYMRRHIWGPLGMTSTTFHPRSDPDILSRTASLVERDENGKLQPLHPNHPFGQSATGIHPEGGGGGCYGTANDYIKLLTSLLRNDGKVLKPETVRRMFSPQLRDPKYLRAVHSNPLSFGMAGNIPIGTAVDFGFGGIINGEELPNTGRAKGALQWGGLPNLFWWISPGDGVAGCYWGQLLPPGDPLSFQLYERFEKAVVESLKEKKDGRGKL